MTGLKRAFAAGVAVLMLGVVSVGVSAAAPYQTAAGAVAGLTGKTVETVAAQRLETGKTYGTLAADAGKLAEFQKAMRELRADTLATQVAAGTITQAQADAALTAFADRQTRCDGNCDGLEHNDHCTAATHNADCTRGAGHDGACAFGASRAAGHHGGTGRRGGCHNR